MQVEPLEDPRRGPIVMTPQPDRTYHVKSTLYPLVLAMYNTAGSARPHLL